MKLEDLDVTETSIVVGLAMGSACKLGMFEIGRRYQLDEAQSPAAVTSAIVALIESLAGVSFDGNFETALDAVRIVKAVHDVRRPPQQPPQ